MIVKFLKAHKFPVLLALFSMVFYGAFAYDLERSDFVKLISLYGALFFFAYLLIKRFGWNFWLLAGFGLVFRLVFLPAIPNLSQDFYRFLWDGRLLIQGVNPYLFTPEMFQAGSNGTTEAVISQVDHLYNGMGALNGSHFSNYPPVNQLCFAIAALFGSKSILGSVITLRIMVVLADLGILYFGKKLLELLELPAKNIFWYFLNPFIIVELTGNLHFEGVMLFFVVWAFYLLCKGKWFWAAILLGVSVSVKLLPLLFLPVFFKFFVKQESVEKGFWKLSGFYLVTLVTVLITFVPFLSSEFISNFSKTIALWFQDFEFNASVYYIIRWIGFQTIGWNIIADVGKILPLVVLFVVLLLTFFRRNSTPKQLLTALLFAVSVYFLLSTTVHPWYIATPLILSVFTRYRFPVVWSLMVMVSYHAYGPDGFAENLWWVALEYVVVIGYMVWEFFSEKKSFVTPQKSNLLPQNT